MFVGRKKELASLEEIYRKPAFGMAVIYGRRRIGKSTMIAEFIKGKKSVFYTATKVGKENNLALFCSQVMDVLSPDISGISFTTTFSLLKFIADNVGEEKLVITIDELPYWAEKDEGLLSEIQKAVDTLWLNKNIMLILCGSALSFMENKVLSEKSPLFGRRDIQIRLETFNYREAAEFVPEYSYEEKAICYGITGGVAKYLALIDPNKSLDDNIKRLFFNNNGYLYDETRNLLSQEFTDITLVNNIIELIASGENALNVIADKVHQATATVLYSLEKLINVGLIEKKYCITEEKNRKKTMYVLKDTMFKFWYMFIPKATSVIEIGRGDIYYDKAVRPYLHSYMGSVFEDMCRFFTLEQGISEAYGSFITRTGNWWGVESHIIADQGRVNLPVDIDVVGISDIDHSAVVGECKFRNDRIDKSIYDTLLQRSALISDKFRIKKLLFFSLSGYTEWFDHTAENVVTYTLADMYETG